MLVTFPAYGRSASCTFKCLACQKDKRKRTFRVEMTVNPYNTNPDGTMKTAAQVVHEAQAAANLERDRFLAYPFCKSCEDARSWSEMKAILGRRAVPSPPLAHGDASGPVTDRSAADEQTVAR